MSTTQILFKLLKTTDKVATKESVVDIVDTIEELFDKKPDGRKRIELTKWKQEINPLIEQVNKLSKLKMYSKQ